MSNLSCTHIISKGTGKSQICLTLSLQCQLSINNGGLDGKCAYMSCGEGEFPIRRLLQLAGAYEAKTGISQNSFVERVLIQKSYTPDEAQLTLTKSIPDMCRMKNVRLLIIDSLAGLVRTEYDTKNKNEMFERTSFLFKLAQSLKWLASAFGLCIVVVNQATSDFEEVGFGRINSTFFDAASVKPALGLAWTSCVNVRIMLRRLEISDAESSLFQYEPMSEKNSSCTSIDSLERRQTEINKRSAVFLSASTNSEDLSPALKSDCLGRDGEWSVNNVLPQYITDSSATSYPLSSNLSGKKRSLRNMTLEFSPSRASRVCRYEITQSGVSGIEE